MTKSLVPRLKHLRAGWFTLCPTVRVPATKPTPKMAKKRSRHRLVLAANEVTSMHPRGPVFFSSAEGGRMVDFLDFFVPIMFPSSHHVPNNTFILYALP